MSFSNIDVEEVFADFVEEYGGIVSDRLPSEGPKTTNADYIFYEAKVVAELKILRDDPFKNKEFRKSHARIEKECVERGYITLDQLMKVTRVKELPDKCRTMFEKLYVRPLKTHVEKANKQIKATKVELKLADYKGLLILISDGNYFLDPKNIRMGLSGLLANRYSSINTVSYLTVNMVTTRPDDPHLSRLWINLWRDSDKPENEVPLPFLNDLYDKWANHYSKVTGILLRKISEMNERGITEVDVLKSTRFVRPRGY